MRSHADINFWADVDAVFSAAVDLPPEARPALLEARCDGRPDVRAEVESLLAAHDQATGFLQPSGGQRSPSPIERKDPAELSSEPVEPFGPGTPVGAYRLVEKIGEGGMGSVFRAERADEAFAHDVAVKITRGSLVGADAARRFRVERQILATLHHPHIVTLIDGGRSRGGQAYLVMELVDGVPITARLPRARVDPRGTAAAVPPGLLGRALRASPRHRPSRLEAGQHPADAGRSAEGAGLRRGQAPRGEPGERQSHRDRALPVR